MLRRDTGLRQLRTARPTWLLSRWYSAAVADEPQPLIVATDLAAPGSGHIRILELNRPSARNAISRALLSSLRGHVEAVQAQYDAAGKEAAGAGGETGPTRALIIASAVDSSFCAGADLKERRGFTAEECVPSVRVCTCFLCGWLAAD